MAEVIPGYYKENNIISFQLTSYLPPLIRPLVLIADIDNEVMNVTTVVANISKTPCAGTKTYN